jgi:putative ABC transport system permease protein
MNWMAETPRSMAEVIAEASPHVLSVAQANFYGRAEQALYRTDTEGQKELYLEQFLLVTQEFTDLFTFKILEGSTSLKEPEKVLIPRSLAMKFFGSEPATGKLLTQKDGNTYTVGGVYRDFPRNSSVPNRIYAAIPEGEGVGQWGNSSYMLFFRTDGQVDLNGLLESFKKSLHTAAFDQGIAWDEIQFRFTPITDMHFKEDMIFDAVPKSSFHMIFILLGIAFAIIAIAGINFTNFSMALTPKRIRSVNTQRVFGASKGQIRMAMIVEAITICVVSCLIGAGLVYTMQGTPLAALVDADIALTGHPLLTSMTFLMAIAVGTLAGLYPAFHIVSFPVALALKGNFGLSPKGRRMRSVLVGIQFVASFILVIAASFMYMQNRFMLHSPLGYDRDALIVAELGDEVQRDVFTDRLKSGADIENVAFTQGSFSSRDDFSRQGGLYRGESIQYGFLSVTPSFLDVMGIQVTEGRAFRGEDRNIPEGVFIFNEKARQEFGLELNERVIGPAQKESNGGEIVGFIPDMKFASFRIAVAPMAFFVASADSRFSQYGHAYIKVKPGADLRAAMAHVRQTLNTFDKGFPFNVRFFDDVLNNLYEKEQRIGMLITLFSLVAVLIAIVGVFGLVVFDSEYRRKEIGIRKVFGASTGEILMTFNKSYIRILVLCFVLSAPVAWYAVSKWLESFAYKTPMYWWVYLAAFAAVFVLTVSTVTFQNWRAANMNPVESIKSN